MKLQDKLRKFRESGNALLATNFYNYETLSGVLQAAKKMEQPIILQLSESSINYMGLDIATNMARTALKQYGVEGWLHLDHGSSLELVKKCLDAGFDSVMIDASEKPMKENIEISSEAVKIAEEYNVNVEAELGYVAKLGQAQEMKYTQPEEAKAFVDATGVSALAISIGSAHGFYKSTPNLQLDLLSRIKEVTQASLVLHGSSGIPDDQLTEAIKRGIVKVNLATEIKNIFMKTLQKELANTDEIDLRVVFPKATQEVINLISKKMKVVC